MKPHLLAALIAVAARLFAVSTLACGLWACEPSDANTLPYTIVGTGQTACYDNFGEIAPPNPGDPFYGQDAQHPGHTPSYRDNGDGTVTDLVTGLMWVKARGVKVGWADAAAGASNCRVGGFTDWRMPSIKELYSLIDFNGFVRRTAADSTPFIDTGSFDFVYGNEAAGERMIDCQDWSGTKYLSTTMGGNETAFGVNFADGRIKGYPITDPRTQTPHKLFVRYVRLDPMYGHNTFVDNGDGTVTDRATGLMWQKGDNSRGVDWQHALTYASTLTFAGHHDWRLPTAKELQSIVDYTRSPATNGTAAIDPIFTVTTVESFYWTSTTHLEGPPDRYASEAVYIAFGRGTGYMAVPPGWGQLELMDVHGAGCQRSDPKTGNPANYPHGRGPQGDEIRIFNFARCVRDAGGG